MNVHQMEMSVNAFEICNDTGIFLADVSWSTFVP